MIIDIINFVKIKVIISNFIFKQYINFNIITKIKNFMTFYD